MQDAMKETQPYKSANGGLGLPMQAAPIDRTPAGIALAAGSGIEAAGWWDVIKKGAGWISRL
ncbi:MAG: hypothetical protein ACRDRX_06060 [Pseudonocardiaceae bacterium]